MGYRILYIYLLHLPDRKVNKKKTWFLNSIFNVDKYLYVVNRMTLWDYKYMMQRLVSLLSSKEEYRTAGLWQHKTRSKINKRSSRGVWVFSRIEWNRKPRDPNECRDNLLERFWVHFEGTEASWYLCELVLLRSRVLPLITVCVVEAVGRLRPWSRTAPTTTVTRQSRSISSKPHL